MRNERTDAASDGPTARPAVIVAGGTYRERCRESRWDELFGSGLRAAFAIRQLGHGVTLATYVSESQCTALNAYAAIGGIRLSVADAPATLQFVYTHGLSRPLIDPPLHLLGAADPLHVEGDAVLRFGMLEGDAVVHGQWVVYDPQSRYAPRPFTANGSTAQHLAIVANCSEAELLTGKTSAEAAARALVVNHGAEVAVVKQGATGVLVCTAAGVSRVPAFRTSSVFPIGSGDVFSAVFTAAWAGSSCDPVAAAEMASRATAAYCAAPRLPLRSDGTSGAGFSPISPSVGGRQPRRVYLAGPFFTTAERWLVDEAYEALSHQGVAVFSPFHDVGIGPAERVARADLQGLDESDAVLAIVNGFDTGTLFEIGYARSRGIPVVAFVQNPSPDREPEPLKMLIGTGCELVDDFVSAVYRAAWAALERPVAAPAGSSSAAT